MKAKKLIATALVAGILFGNCVPAIAIANKDKPVIKSQVSEYKFNDVNLKWWNDYNDEFLSGYIVKAIDENQDLKIATLKVEEARQNVKLQFSKELPSATVGVSPAVLKGMGTTSSDNMFAVPMLVSYEADIFLKNHDKTKSVKKNYEISKIDERAAYISIASAVGSTYFNIVKLDELISIQEEIVASRYKIYELMKLRNQQGITSTADAIRAEKAYIISTTDLIDLEKARTILLNRLAVLTGDSPNNINELKRISYKDLTYKREIPQEISSEVITQRPDYLIAEKKVEKAGLDVKIAKKEFLPNINILGLVMFAASSASNSLSWTNSLAALGAGAMLPIFTGGAKISNLRLNKNKYEQVLQNYYKTNLTAIQEVNDSLSTLKLDDEKYNKDIKTLAMESADFKFTQARYNQGVISNLDLTQRKENLLVIKKLVASDKIDCFIDEISLYKATGGKI